MSWFFAPLDRRAYDVVMIDPAWPWETWSAKGAAKSPSAHYDCMSMEEIAALPVADLLAPEGVVIVWCTFPLIGKQHMIVENGWGLDVKTGGVWSKRTINNLRRVGTGKVKRSVCEPYLIACHKSHRLRARGRAANLIETFDREDVDGLAREHSRKPEQVYLDVEEQTPGWRRADVFARTRRAGWDSFGKEINKF